MGHLEGNFTPVLYMGRKVPKGQYYIQVHNSDSEKRSGVLTNGN